MAALNRAACPPLTPTLPPTHRRCAGLDPASRQNLWSVVREAKRDRAIILTTHSMEEATALCDRLGIFVDGSLACIGNPKELTARYGGYYVFTLTTPPSQEAAAHDLVLRMSPGARLTYALAGTRKYELPVTEVTLPGARRAPPDQQAGTGARGRAGGTWRHVPGGSALALSGSHRPHEMHAGVFEEMERAKSQMDVLDWGIANATLEEVFIRFARSIGAEGGL